MKITVDQQISKLEKIISQCLQLTDKVRSDHEPWQRESTYTTIEHIRSEYFSALSEAVCDLIRLLKSDEIYTEMTDYDYKKVVSDAEKKLDELPFGSADWQRHYGYIEGLKQVKFYTVNKE